MIKNNFIKSLKEILRAHKLEILAAAQKSLKRKRKGHAVWVKLAWRSAMTDRQPLGQVNGFRERRKPEGLGKSKVLGKAFSEKKQNEQKGKLFFSG